MHNIYVSVRDAMNMQITYVHTNEGELQTNLYTCQQAKHAKLGLKGNVKEVSQLGLQMSEAVAMS